LRLLADTPAGSQVFAQPTWQFRPYAASGCFFAENFEQRRKNLSQGLTALQRKILAWQLTADDNTEQDTNDEVPHGHTDHDADNSDVLCPK
jgi:hypothetical protein